MGSNLIPVFSNGATQGFFLKISQSLSSICIQSLGSILSLDPNLDNNSSWSRDLEVWSPLRGVARECQLPCTILLMWSTWKVVV
ncbi:hypothetical protein ACFXTI_003338 [Malus domestica]